MQIGCPKERKVEEFRIALTPTGVSTLVSDGHEIVIETGAGDGAGFSDYDYRAAGATIGKVEDVWAADLVVKVKEPIDSEYQYLSRDTLLFCYLHLAAVPKLADELVKRKVTSIAFETITGPGGSLPLLKPMSIIAGRLAVQVGAGHLQKDAGGAGVLLSGAPGVPPGHVVVIGCGTAGDAAIRTAVGMGARVTAVDVNPTVLTRIEREYAGRVETLMDDPVRLAETLRTTDLLVGAVLVPGAKAPQVVSREMVKDMGKNTVIVDIAVDQGGCIETTRPTTHEEPTYIEEDVIHYAVTNMPSLVSRTSTLALSSVTLPVLRRIAKDPDEALSDAGIRLGLTTHDGSIVHPAVKAALAKK